MEVLFKEIFNTGKSLERELSFLNFRVMLVDGKIIKNMEKGYTIIKH